ncbi:pyruvate formate lyase family protein [Diaphorobacter aerolatus]|nr:pyruvate formate lyase family protein [Diaphorobacter aerolatus]
MPEPLSRCAIAADVRRVALYGLDFLCCERRIRLTALNDGPLTRELLHQRRDLSAQIRAMEALRETATAQGIEIARPAASAHEAVLFMCLTAIWVASEAGQAAFPIGRLCAFLDVYIQRDLIEQSLTEQRAQQLVAELVGRLHGMQVLVARLREAVEAVEAVDFRDPVECIAGLSVAGQAQVTRTSFRILEALRQCTARPAPPLAVLWSLELPQAFRDFCTDVARDTGAVQFHRDAELRAALHGDHDYVVGRDTPALRVGRQVLLDAGHVNLPKALLYAINGGVDEQSGVLVVPGFEPCWDDVLDYEKVVGLLDRMLDWLAATCIHAFNGAHLLRERSGGGAHLALALHDSRAACVVACHVDGLCVLANSLSAIRYAAVEVLRNDDGLAVDFMANESFPARCCDGGVAEGIADALCEALEQKLRAQPYIYRNARPVVLPGNAVSNAISGKKTGNTPCGRRAAEAFPMLADGLPLAGRQPPSSGGQQSS